MNGFYVPGSVSSSYVANKRNEEGSLLYDTMSNEIGLEKQAAFQQLEKDYSSTIENAYAAYLAANRSVDASRMGQGYKELYKQLQNEQLRANIAATNLELGEQRQLLNRQEAEAQSQIQAQFKQEVAYFDRLQQTFTDYLEYVKGLTHSSSGTSYLSTQEMSQSIDTMYDVLYSVQPQAYLDTEGNVGMTFQEYLRSQLKDIDADTQWSNWVFTTGLNEFMAAPKKMYQYAPGEAAANAKKRAEEKAKKEAEAKAKKEAEEKAKKEQQKSSTHMNSMLL